METNSKTLIVVMPVYNSEKTLDAAISSVLNQSYRNLRLFIVDDCSKDSSVSIAKKYLTDPRVRLFKNSKNMGAYYSRNLGLYYAKHLDWGYFTVHDSDDISFDHRYLKMITKFRSSDKIVAVKDRVRRVDLYSKKNLREHSNMSHAIFKKTIFYNLGYFENVRFGADSEYWERAEVFSAHAGFVLGSTEEILGMSYIHENNLTVLIPGKSKARRSYTQRYKKTLAFMSKKKNWYMNFRPVGVTEEM